MQAHFAGRYFVGLRCCLGAALLTALLALRAVNKVRPFPASPLPPLPNGVC